MPKNSRCCVEPNAVVSCCISSFCLKKLRLSSSRAAVLRRFRQPVRCHAAKTSRAQLRIGHHRKILIQQNHQTLLKAKYCLRVAAASRTQKKNVTLTFDPWPWNPTGFQKLSRYTCVQNFIKLSAAVHELSTLDFRRLKISTANISGMD